MLKLYLNVSLMQKHSSDFNHYLLAFYCCTGAVSINLYHMYHRLKRYYKCRLLLFPYFKRLTVGLCNEKSCDVFSKAWKMKVEFSKRISRQWSSKKGNRIEWHSEPGCSVMLLTMSCSIFSVLIHLERPNQVQIYDFPFWHFWQGTYLCQWDTPKKPSPTKTG